MPKKSSRITRPAVRTVPTIVRNTMPNPRKSRLRLLLFLVLGSVLIFLVIWYKANSKPKITIGLNVELSGAIPAVGLSSQRAARLAVKEVNDEGGLLRPDKQYPIILMEEDNNADVEKTKQATKRIVESDAIAMIGPNASKYAIAAASVAEPADMLMISPWSTNPVTTQNKRYIFRAAFIDPFQGKAVAIFASETLKVKKAAVFYDETAEVLKGQGEFFADTFTSQGGLISLTETFKAGDTDFSTQLKAIEASGADVIFLPAYYNDAANIIKQAKELGIKIPFLGSDAWGSQEILNGCRDACEGYYLSAHYAADSTAPATKKFVENYKKAYGEIPDDVAALTYDAFGLLFKSIQNARIVDREAIKNTMTKITGYEGVTGNMEFIPNSGNPKKNVIILQIKDGKFTYIQDIKP